MAEKRTPKSKDEITADIEQKQKSAFIDAIGELETKHGYRLVPVLEYKYNGVFPTVAIQKTNVQEEVDKITEGLSVEKKPKKEDKKK